LSKWDVKNTNDESSIKKVCSIKVKDIGIINTIAFDNKKFLVVGGASPKIQVFEVNNERNCEDANKTFNQITYLNDLKGHKEDILSLAFKKNSEILYSASKDRTLKVWDLNIMTFIDSLYGHQCGVTSVDTLYKERCVSVGGRDGKVCLFKIPEESCLTFEGSAASGKNSTSLDNVKLVNENTFITANAEDGNISLWQSDKRRPKFSVSGETDDSSHGKGNWISSLCTLTNSDIFATGSNNGEVIIWQLLNKNEKFQVLKKIKVDGFINSLEFLKDGQEIAVCVGQ